MKHILLLLMSILLVSFSPKPKMESVYFKITNIRNTQGNFVLCFFNNESSYNNKQECIRREISKDNIRNGELQFSMQLPQGTLGVVLLDDENLNDEMDYGFMLPKEGFGFSNFYPMLSKPSFRDIHFQVPYNFSTQPIVIKVKYM